MKIWRSIDELFEQCAQAVDDALGHYDPPPATYPRGRNGHRTKPAVVLEDRILPTEAKAYRSGDWLGGLE